MVQTVAYFTGFETGDTSEITLEAGTGTAQTTTKRTGGYAFQSANAAPATVNFISGLTATSALVRMYFRFASSTPAGDCLIADFDNLVKPVLVGLNGSKQLYIRDSAIAITTGTKVLAENTWYRIEFVFNKVGLLQAYVDGVVEVSTTESGAGITAARFRFAGDSASDVFLDDVRLDVGGSALVGDGQVIARQGKAGAPTDNAWTKNGLATSALCWSETPFGAVNNCSSSTASAAQTMLVGAFSSAGSASEGSQIVGSGDAVNACKTAIVGVTTGSSTGALIRRRINGVSTDTAVTYSNADAYYDDGIWTTTVANLDLLEAGGVHGTDTNLENIEDVWVMVDYTPIQPLMGQILM